MTNTFVFNLSPDKNGGESIILTCSYVNDYIMNGELELNSYGSCASISTCDVFTSENMFKLAKELQRFEIEQDLKSN